jgi:hypothetical protein
VTRLPFEIPSVNGNTFKDFQGGGAGTGNLPCWQSTKPLPKGRGEEEIDCDLKFVQTYHSPDNINNAVYRTHLVKMNRINITSMDLRLCLRNTLKMSMALSTIVLCNELASRMVLISLKCLSFGA